MSGGGKGGSQSTSVQVPAWLESAAQQNLGRADQVSQLGYTPYYGPDVAAMTPMQIAAMQGTNQAASAFGLPTADPMAGMPQAQDYGGMSAYSSAPMFEQSVAALRANAPGQANAMAGMFIDPITGQMASQPMAQQPAQMQPAQNRNRTSTSASVMPMGATSGMIKPQGFNWASSQLASRLPGGINTANPNSIVNRLAASVARPQQAPTSANRPMTRPQGR